MLTTRRGFFGLLAGAVIAAKAAPSVVPVSGIPLVSDPNYVGHMLMICHPSVKVAYEDLVRSEESFWRSSQ